MLDGLVGGTIFTQANGIMGHDIDDALLHEGREAHRAAGIVCENHEGAAIGHKALVQGDPVHRSGHAMLADAVMDVTPLELAGTDRFHALRDRQVRMRQVGRTTNCERCCVVDDCKRHFR